MAEHRVRSKHLAGRLDQQPVAGDGVEAIGQRICPTTQARKRPGTMSRGKLGWIPAVRCRIADCQHCGWARCSRGRGVGTWWLGQSLGIHNRHRTRTIRRTRQGQHLGNILTETDNTCRAVDALTGRAIKTRAAQPA